MSLCNIDVLKYWVPVHILFFTRRYYPQIGGVETHVREISKVLLQKGYRITVIAEEASSVISQKNQIVDGIEVIRIHGGKDDWFKKVHIWISIWKKRHIIKHADVVHCHDVFFWYFPFRLIYPGKKAYTTFHGYETVYPPTHKAIIIRKISELLSNGNICVGNYIEKWYRTRADFVTYGGVGTTRTHIIDKKSYAKRLKILLIGRFENDIGVPTYLNGLSILRKKKVVFDFHAVGEGSLYAVIKKFGKVHAPTQDALLSMKSVDIVFCSSYLLMLEALRMKKIVVAVYDNKLKEDYIKLSPFASLVYICKDAKEVAVVVESIQESPWKSTNMKEKGYKWAKNQTWKHVAGLYISLWQK